MPGLLDSLLSTNTEAEANCASAKAKQSDLVLFASQLSVMLSSGIVLSEAVEAIATQTNPGPFQTVLFDVSDRIQAGESFSTAISAYPKIFNSMFIGVIEASEASGKMPEMLDVLQGYLEGEMDTKKQVQGALVYPAIMLVMAIVATSTLLFFVLPKFTKIYESRGQALPKLTQMLVSFSKIATEPKSGSIMLVVLGILIGGVIYALRTEWGQRALDYLKLHTPILGTMFVDSIMTRSTRIMATMLNAGVTLLDTLRIIEKSCDNCFFKTFWSETCDRVEGGAQFSEAMSFASYSELLSPATIQMIKAGEKGGNLGSVCEKISSFYDKRLKGSIKAVTTMIEPLMITVMGVVIGTIAIALLLPIFKISSIMAH
ncbi:MAG: type II secretion system F family protein [Phycisphaerae bacterium]|jgi:type IV pilus assembly protein PilC